MGYPSSQISTVGSLFTLKSVEFAHIRLRRLDISLLMETTLVALAAILAIRVFAGRSVFGTGWFVAPAVLAAGALVPTAIKGRKFAKIGLRIDQAHLSLAILAWSCLAILPTMFLGLWLLKSCGVVLPLRPVPAQNQQFVAWLFYQFMYVAVAEEVFFRGYIQSNILRSLQVSTPRSCIAAQWITIGISAAFFAGAHVITQGTIISGLTFFPGLVLGWLFARTKSLLAPILFHGIANTSYFVMAAVFA